MQTPTPPPFPPSGWLTQEQAATRLGVKPALLHKSAWKWRPTLIEHGISVPKPTGWRCVIYPVDQIERIAAALESEALARNPEGFISRREAMERFNVSAPTWLAWNQQGKITARKLPNGGRMTRTLYALADLERLRESVRDERRVHTRADGSIHIPPGFIRRETAWGMFGVNRATWERWEREGTITCGVYNRPWPKLYPLAEIKRLLLEFGRLSPPYPDALHPGCHRVPLPGRNIRRREVLVDAATLPLIESGLCNWGGLGNCGYVKYTSPDGRGCVPLRRLILGVHEIVSGRDGGERGGGIHIGHANDDPLDCRRENLVVRTAEQRQRHRRKGPLLRGRPTSSQFKGVCWLASLKRWVVQIRYQGKSRRLGQFTDEIAAAAAYDEAARQWYGEHARYNFPDGVEAWIERDQAARQAETPETPARAA